MVGTLLGFALLALQAVVIVRFAAYFNERHALEGRFGRAERERVLARRGAQVVRHAEEVARVAATRR